MPRYFADISFDGSHYHGWQIQENANTVQAETNKALSVILGNEIMTTGAGRTDTGVHATQMILHFDVAKTIDEKDLIYRFNSITPADIAMNGVYQVADEAHARFDATERSYRYVLTSRKDPFQIKKAFYFPHELDLKAMNEACDILKEHKHFASFSKSGVQTKTDICRIDEAVWNKEGDQILFHITADRFLRNMVRAIVGTMLDIGQDKMKPAELHEVLNSKDRSEAGTSVPAHGLYLTSVVYPEEKIKVDV